MLIEDRYDASITTTNPALSPLERCFDERETAQIIGVSTALLRKRRRLKLGPPFIRIGRLVRYRASDIRSFIENSSRQAGE